MLMGEYHNHLDDKGRVVIPSKLREELGSFVVLTRGLDGSLFLYSESIFKTLTEKLMTLSFTEKESHNMTRLMISGATTLEFDKQGRINIPSFLKDYASLDKEVVIIGVLNRLEIWSYEKWMEFVHLNIERLSDVSIDLFRLN